MFAIAFVQAFDLEFDVGVFCHGDRLVAGRTSVG